MEKLIEIERNYKGKIRGIRVRVGRGWIRFCIWTYWFTLGVVFANSSTPSIQVSLGVFHFDIVLWSHRRDCNCHKCHIPF